MERLRSAKHYFGEFLSQGVLRIEGNCSIVSMQDIIDIGLIQLRPEFEGFETQPPKWANKVVMLRQMDNNVSGILPIDENYVRIAMHIGDLFGMRWKWLIVDDMTETASGYWYAADPREKLGDCAAKVLRRLAAGDAARRLLKLENGELAVRAQGWRQYTIKFDRFRMLLFFLVHLCSSVPARGPDILSARYANATHATRSLFICDRQVVITAPPPVPSRPQPRTPASSPQ